ncbi:leucine--tRNA ligase [Aeromicrobium wangtongii]|uniref:Leucine--tRNA ligase n=1 Tax=Aeromicrobium wangtongii TaxID=2969247 RepID=A0ABY5MCB5_9ACTN|nr:leucine--tRNA ligase [Aeromicrobium wangtongii]MCD9197312.1 leucine--tRNA ligase [Aeromicrobium wangtongii]UUP14806.1 leucine--tRNA ligase [Aeromicrobium wangtongii]
MSTPEETPTSYRYTSDLAGDIERRWQDRWDAEGTFEAPNPVGDLAGDVSGDKYFIMDMFPYPSGAGLHVGHPLGYIATDVVGRYRRMLGDNVLHALGYDAFGLPAEIHAVQTGEHPRTNTLSNIANMRRQLRRLGLAHDPRRSFATIDPDFVRWTQWIFIQIFESWYDEDQQKARPISELRAEYESGVRTAPDGAGWAELGPLERRILIDSRRLAYVDESPVNWCPGLGTVLANEEVTAEGRSERGNFPVFTRNLRQWKMRITAYSDRLIDDLERVDWPESVKNMQRNWIGRSHGARVRFDVPAAAASFDVFTTRPDTLFGATYAVLAPEHELVGALTTEAWPEGTPRAWTNGVATPAEAVAAYRAAAAAKTDLERQENKDKTGVFTGSYAVNPVNGEQIPVFIADYVLTGYGTGAIMAVPGGDQRDWEFAQAYGLPIIHTVQPPEGVEGAYPGEGPAVNSAHGDLDINGLAVDAAKTAVIEWLQEHGAGEGTTTYRLRDWLFSRQRYWGEPFPIVYDELDQPIAVPDHMLPVELPDVPDYSPKTYEPEDADSEPEPPLARADDWVHVLLDLGDGPRHYRRETNTMPNWAGSSWYELRYTDPHNTEAIADPENERYWLGPRTPGGTGGVDLYVGGVEHAVLHLLYARFWHKVLFDLGHVSSEEPFHRLFNQGYIQAYAYVDERGTYVPADQVEERDGGYWYAGKPVTREYGKMGKSLKNVVTPDEMYDAYGADTFRVYEMSMGPLDVSRPWETRAVVGSQRFLQRVWRLLVDEETGDLRVDDEPLDAATLHVLHTTIDGVRGDMQDLRFNTAIAKLIELTNHLTKVGVSSRAAVEPLVLMLAPLAPHLAEELWSRLGHTESLTHAAYPVADPAHLTSSSVTCVVQVLGKVRGKLEVSPDISDDELTALALAEPNVVKTIDGREIRKVIVKAPKLVSIVV